MKDRLRKVSRIRFKISQSTDLLLVAGTVKEPETGSHAARDLGKFRFYEHALQHAEMGVCRNSPHLQLPLFLRTCLTGICIEGKQKQSVPKQYIP